MKNGTVMLHFRFGAKNLLLETFVCHPSVAVRFYAEAAAVGIVVAYTAAVVRGRLKHYQAENKGVVAGAYFGGYYLES